MKQLTFLILGIILISSCEQDAYFTVPDGNTKLYAFSEINTNDKVKVYVNTAVGINTDDSFVFPKQSEAQVILLEDGEELEDPGFRYLKSQGAFVSQGSFRPIAGVQYGLKVIFNDSDLIDPISGNTIIPIPDTLHNVKLNSVKERYLPHSEKELDVTVEINLKEMTQGLYVLRAYIDNNGIIENLIVRDIKQNDSGAYFSSFNKGILVNKEKLGEDLNVVFTTENNVKADLELKEVKLELLTITEEAYNYYKSISKQTDAQSSSISEPVIAYSNFENGLGLFAGYSSSSLTLDVK